MKKRIITAAIAVLAGVLIIILSEFNPFFLAVPIAALCVISVLELSNVLKITSKMLRGVSVAYAAVAPFLVAGDALVGSITKKSYPSVPIDLHTVLLLCTILYALLVLHSMIKH